MPRPRQVHSNTASRSPIGFISLEGNLLNWHIQFYEALIYDLALSLALTILTVVSGVIALDMFVDDYPPDIKKK